MTPNSTDLTRAQLIGMIGTLRAALYDCRYELDCAGVSNFTSVEEGELDAIELATRFSVNEAHTNPLYPNN